MSSTNDLPDPTEDLQWSRFEGPIVDRLAEHAARDPARPCVIETLPHRSFSYGVIDHAASLLAYYLIGQGISRGDVVMLYSARCVDLVVAYMGVLRAGATVSVLDPQYPPDRQIVYLDVSRPRAIVTLKRAKQTAGGFDTKVDSWITENLDLKAQVPDLMLQDNGSLRSGLQINGGDAFDNVAPSDLPIIGPDDIPTLSFTSGSEGKPKGVRGRHFSLTHYFPWMKERFGLSHHDRFTMLSGIAHDPIQRDIFTPLFLGASLWIPSPDDIDHQKLAAWMLEYKTTVTHLTPAMAQIMIGEASNQFPDLRNAFLVGDVLIKRDVRTLQGLAPNATVINMFGTTETQRAVSHYAVPSRNEDPTHLDHLPDFIPAGKGMKGVQLLVVDRQNKHRICGRAEEGAKPEEGEIYVRAAGLAEGYLNEPKLNEQKFLDSWFVDPKSWTERDQLQSAHEPWRQYYEGPRDRMYRSGDVGYYDKNGNVICTGRIDDQVKVRGFRVELNDIDAKLSHHFLVARSVTVLRKQEEQIISYVEPAWKEWKKYMTDRDMTDEEDDGSMVGILKRFHHLRNEVRDYLKTKLAIHEVPTQIIPLKKMPLTPNGKPDRKAVPYPTQEELNASRISTGSQLSPMMQKVAKIWSEVLDIDPDSINSTDSWTDLGGDSMKALKVLKTVRKELRNVQQRDLYSHPTLAAFSLVCDPEAAANGVSGSDEANYAVQAERLLSELPRTFLRYNGSPKSYLLTGATGFLGSFVLDGLLKQVSLSKVFCLVRGTSGKRRLQDTLAAYGLSYDAERIQCVQGDLSKPDLGLSSQDWTMLCDTVDVVVHNGARVDWLLNYRDLQAVNVGSTLSVINMAASRKAKNVVFVSTTAVLDTDSFAGQTVYEDDDLSRSKTGLDAGYGQTKWVSENLIREAGRRGLTGFVVRPGYILGDSKNGCSITDDFLIRMLVGCIQVGSCPPIENTINMVPVDYVASLVVAASTMSPHDNDMPGVSMLQVTPQPRDIGWSAFLQVPQHFGYTVKQAQTYETWRDLVLAYVDKHNDWAAMPLLELITSDFPSSTIPRYLDDRNARTVLNVSGISPPQSRIDPNLTGLYLSYLVAVGFISAPKGSAGTLPATTVADAQLDALRQLSGRGKLGAGIELGGQGQDETRRFIGLYGRLLAVTESQVHSIEATAQTISTSKTA